MDEVVLIDDLAKTEQDMVPNGMYIYVVPSTRINCSLTYAGQRVIRTSKWQPSSEVSGTRCGKICLIDFLIGDYWKYHLASWPTAHTVRMILYYT